MKMLYTSFLANNIVDHIFRGQTYVPPTATMSVGLLTSTMGPRQNSFAYTSGDTISLTANDGKTHLYECTSSGTTASSQSTLYPGVFDEVITDGTADFTEQTSAALRPGTAVEASYTGYSRTVVAASLANWAGTQGAGTTAASNGTSVPTTSNNGTITIGTSNTGTIAYIWAQALFDVSTSGNMLTVEGLNTVKTINPGDPAPFFSPAGLSFSVDN
jgi:hypothetical protein